MRRLEYIQTHYPKEWNVIKSVLNLGLVSNSLEKYKSRDNKDSFYVRQEEGWKLAIRKLGKIQQKLL